MLRRARCRSSSPTRRRRRGQGSDERLGKKVKFWHDELGGVCIKASFYYGRVLDVRVETDGAKLYLVEEEDQESGKKKERHWYNLDAMQALGQGKHKSKMMDRVIWGWKHSTIPPPPRRRRSARGQTRRACRRCIARSPPPRRRRRRIPPARRLWRRRTTRGRAGGRAGGEARDGAGEAREGAESTTSGGGTAKLARWLEDEDLDRNTGSATASAPSRSRRRSSACAARSTRRRCETSRRTSSGTRSSATASSAGAPARRARAHVDGRARVERLQLERQASRQAQYRSVTWQDCTNNVEQRPIVVHGPVALRTARPRRGPSRSRSPPPSPPTPG